MYILVKDSEMVDSERVYLQMFSFFVINLHYLHRKLYSRSNPSPQGWPGHQVSQTMIISFFLPVSVVKIPNLSYFLYATSAMKRRSTMAAYC